MGTPAGLLKRKMDLTLRQRRAWDRWRTPRGPRLFLRRSRKTGRGTPVFEPPQEPSPKQTKKKQSGTSLEKAAKPVPDEACSSSQRRNLSLFQGKQPTCVNRGLFCHPERPSLADRPLRRKRGLLSHKGIPPAICNPNPHRTCPLCRRRYLTRLRAGRQPPPAVAPDDSGSVMARIPDNNPQPRALLHPSGTNNSQAQGQSGGGRAP